MNDIFLIPVFLFGAIIGSFLNVIIFRYNTNMTFGGRSLCLYCGKELSWYEMVPILSFLFLSGRCATCKSRLSLQYPLVELATAIFFLGAYLHAAALYAGGMLAFYTLYLFLAGSLLIIISVYDLRHTIIPDRLVFIFCFLALLRLALFPAVAEGAALALLAGPLLATPFALLFFISDGRLAGLGDAKLALGIGWLLGMGAGLVALLFSFWIGGAVALILLSLGAKRFTMKSEIPFGPYLAIGTFIALMVPAGRLFSLLIF